MMSSEPNYNERRAGMPETDEDVIEDEVTGTDADESQYREVVIDKELIKEAHEEPLRDKEQEGF